MTRRWRRARARSSAICGLPGALPRFYACCITQLDAPRAQDGKVIGIGREQWMLVAAALTLGGSVRVGLEDNFYLPDGTMARSNGELVAQARRMTADIGRRPATVEEARELLGVVKSADADSIESSAGAELPGA